MKTAGNSSLRIYSFADRSRARTEEKPAMISSRARRMRLVAVGIILLMAACGIVSRLYSLQIGDTSRWRAWATRQHFTEVELASERGPIFDRNKRMLAISVPAGSVYAHPSQINDKAGVAKKLAEVLGISARDALKRISSEKPFVWIERQIPRKDAERVAKLNLPGVGYFLESKRFYPYNRAASALVGKVGLDGVGLSGIEQRYESRLRGEESRARASRDALGNLIHVNGAEEFTLPKGDSLQLTIDATLQMIADEEVEAARIGTNAKHAMAVMIDSDSGEILVMSQSPGLNFNVDAVSSKEALKNLIVETTFEPGSVLKPIVAAFALDEGVVRASDIINCEHGRLPFGGHLIKDVHPSDSISFHDVVVRSSNIGMAKIGMRLGRARLYPGLRRFGFGQLVGLGLPGESGGILRSADSWAAVDVATHSFGQGIAVTPLQVVRAMAAIANGGVLPELHLLSEEKGGGTRVISNQSAAAVQEMLYGVVEDDHGTGGKAVIPGVRVAGKTGTAQKARRDGRGYQPGAYVASFVGFVDASPLGLKKNLTLMVIVDEPHTNSIYGGTLAGPVFQRIMQRSLQFLMSGSGEGAPKNFEGSSKFTEQLA
jgi:cell division protein FtsI (penicillin-binding protein 3)